jgi:formylglycine-generating enzyme required for sulfatase activity
LTDLPPIEIETALDDAPEGFVPDAPIGALRDSAPPPVAEAVVSNSEATTTAALPPPPSVKQETIASLAENALRESQAVPAEDAEVASTDAAGTEADPIAELAWTSTADAAESESFGSYFRDCVDCPDMAEIRKDGAGAYALGVREVTNAQWRACVAEGGCPPIAGGADASPVTGASYVDARAFVAWLSGKTGVAYRLPSEGEWDAAAEGAPASGTAPNPLGLYNMADARIEWTEECWTPDGIAAAAEGACAARVLKGSDRDAAPAGERRRDAGFRVARDLN